MFGSSLLSSTLSLLHPNEKILIKASKVIINIFLKLKFQQIYIILSIANFTKKYTEKNYQFK